MSLNQMLVFSFLIVYSSSNTNFSRSHYSIMQHVANLQSEYVESKETNHSQPIWQVYKVFKNRLQNWRPDLKLPTTQFLQVTEILYVRSILELYNSTGNKRILGDGV